MKNHKQNIYFNLKTCFKKLNILWYLKFIQNLESKLGYNELDGDWHGFLGKANIRCNYDDLRY